MRQPTAPSIAAGIVLIGSTLIVAAPVTVPLRGPQTPGIELTAAEEDITLDITRTLFRPRSVE